MSASEVIIVGAGPVGAALALQLHADGRRVRVIEARPGPSGDRRTLALSEASRLRLAALGGWPDAATPITAIHVSQKGALGRTRLSADDVGLGALGHTLAYGALEAALADRLQAAGVEVSYGAACEAIALGDDGVELTLASGRVASARLLVLADGGANARRIPGLAYDEKDYGQVAITGPVWADRPHAGLAYERFTPEGPVALLPMEERYALVRTASPAKASALLAASEAEFLASLQQHFGDRAGRFVRLGPRSSYSLRLRVINASVARRTLVVGNAAQAMHPIAGQGLNLGLRDAEDAAAAIREAGSDPGEAAVMARYAGMRRRDASRGVAFTDFLVGAFGAEWPGVATGRGLALTALDLLPPLRRALASRMIHGAPGGVS
jgi:2-octaprenyl-6-methoxyphenol hydroxylase